MHGSMQHLHSILPTQRFEEVSSYPGTEVYPQERMSDMPTRIKEGAVEKGTPVYMCRPDRRTLLD